MDQPVLLTPAHEWLLRAVLLDGEAAATAYEQWTRLVPFDDVDVEAYRLLPWLSRNLHKLGVVDALTSRLRGIARRTWYTNQLAVRIVGEAVSALGGSGMATRVLGGGVSILHYRGDSGLYPLDSVDLLLTAEHHDAALAALRRLGWTPHETTHGVSLLKHSQTGFLALHPQIVHGLTRDAWVAASDHVWRRPQPIELEGHHMSLINAEDHLLFMADYGFQGGAPCPLRWLTEAAALMTSDIFIDWEDLLAQARLRHSGAALGALFRSLSTFVSLALPEGYLDALVTTGPTSARAREGQTNSGGRPALRRLRQSCASLWHACRRLANT